MFSIFEDLPYYSTLLYIIILSKKKIVIGFFDALLDLLVTKDSNYEFYA